MSETNVRRKPALQPRWDKGFQTQGFKMTSPRKGTETSFDTGESGLQFGNDLTPQGDGNFIYRPIGAITQ